MGRDFFLRPIRHLLLLLPSSSSLVVVVLYAFFSPRIREGDLCWQ